jgi:hypothetical protein
MTAFRELPDRGPNREQAATGPRHRAGNHGCPPGEEATCTSDGTGPASDTTTSVIDDTGQLVDRWTLTHTQAGIHQAMTRLAGHGRPEHLPVAIEATSPIVVDRLLAAGHPVVPTPPQQLQRRPTPLGSVQGHLRPQ